MLFNSLPFWVFLPLFAVAYFATRGNARLWVCLIGSYIFYGWWDWRFLLLIVALTVFNWWLGLLIDRSDDAANRKFALWASVATSLAVLGFFKYANFMVDSMRALLRSIGIENAGQPLDIILPIGISFYTFQAMSYTIDVYRREIPVEPSLLRFATFKAFFPQLVAGPIVRAADFLPQLRRDAPAEWNRFVNGACMVAWGFVLKVVIADSLAGVVDHRFANPAVLSAVSLAVGVLFYAFQIYGDFAGYSLIAIGLAHILGYDFKRNFDRPYFSESFSEFWRRWHISLSSWLRDYLYIALGGNRFGKWRTQMNLMTTMLLGGLWHGASWAFVAWGALHGAYLIAQRVWSDAFPSTADATGFAARVLRIVAVFLLVCVAWVFFRARTFEDAGAMLARIATQGDWSPATIEQRFQVVKGVSLILMLVLVEALSFRIDFPALLARRPALAIPFLAACLLLIAAAGTFGGTAFIYFQF